MSEVVSYIVRACRKEDVPGAYAITRKPPLPFAKNFLNTWLEIDPEGCQIAVTDSGEVISTCGAFLQHEDFAFIGFYICKEEYRGRGIGYKVWKACIDHIGPNRNVGLNAIPNKLDLYRSGFPIVETDWTGLLYECKEPPVDYTVLSDTPPDGVDVLSFEESLFPSVLEYDTCLMGYSRELLLRLTFREGGSRTMVALKGGKCVGFGTIKTTLDNGGLIGPLYADDPAVAEVLLRRLIVALPQATGFAMLTVSVNVSANEMMEKIGCPKTGECVRMYRKKKIHVDLDKIYGRFDMAFSPF